MADLGLKGKQFSGSARYMRPVVSTLVYKRPAVGDPNVLDIDVDGTLSGVVSIAGVPTEGIQMALMYRPNRNTIGLAITNNTGAYIFRGLDRSDMENYLVICLDPRVAAPWNYTLAKDHLTAG